MIGTKNINKVALLLSFLGLLSALFLPLVSEAPNRIISGTPKYLYDFLPPFVYILYLLLWVGIGLLSFDFVKKSEIFLVFSIIGFLSLSMFSGYYADKIVTADEPYTRVSFSSGFWCMSILWFLLITENMKSFRKNYIYFLSWTFMVLSAFILILSLGIWDNMSLMHEYRAERDVFWGEAIVHVYLALGSTICAFFVAVPLSILSLKSSVIEGIIFGFLNMVQTIPSMALFGLLIVPFAWLASLFPALRQFGVGGIGWAPAVGALTLYAILPIARNIFVAMKNVPVQTIEAAYGMGMTKGQIFFKIIIPLSLPLVLTAIRSTMILLIGLAAVAGLIGAGGFGRFIFQGLGEQAMDKIMLGAIPTVILALLVDLILGACINLYDEREPKL